MATSKTNEFEEYVKGLLECPVCMKSIKSAPIHQCTNGHVVCKDCIPKCENCPICRNDSTIGRNLIFEQIIEKFSAFELAKEESSEKPKIQKWGKGFVSGAPFSNEPTSNGILETYLNQAIQQVNAMNSDTVVENIVPSPMITSRLIRERAQMMSNFWGELGVKNYPKKSDIIYVCSLKVIT